ncbi:ABC transporter substrate-binding protein [Rouxiella silvae]|jgi:octopine/nopaline transport system substrate-binding protein|uniref:ABC transporter substrate-binding protein n=1 Tax=Rouxiella silvae TaxID=1646373 RepID=A0AA40X3M8_9GAMM|nr:transporter substrate-binding domain-containing protein [Rouxiella silvae]KQN46489.1 ABC transporter substrate-binding protein [Serratia sp. Leaf50]MBF6638092.1 transporter substrate-binding domain-containing protein [Rouxiella silvae]ORJ20401.1 ABC transporter substrate-binding protein [Rouxiella silvae]
MKLASLVSALCLTATLVTSFSGHAEEGKKWTVVKIATEGAFRPFNFTKPDGTLDGFEIDLYKVLCQKMNVKCEIVVQPFAGVIPALNAGKFDAIMDGLSATDARRKIIDFSIPYSNTGQTFAVLKDSPLAKLPDLGKRFSLTTDEAGAQAEVAKIAPLLKGKVIGVQGSSIGEQFLQKYMKDIVTIRQYKTTEEHDLDLKSGRVDMVFASTTYLNGAKAKAGNEDMQLTGPLFIGGLLGSGSAVGIRKSDPELKKMFDDAITQVKQDGTLKTLAIKWFGMDTVPQ